MGDTKRLLATGALVPGRALAGAAAAHRLAKRQTITGHFLRPARVDATPERIDPLRALRGFAIEISAEARGSWKRSEPVGYDGALLIRDHSNDVIEQISHEGGPQRAAAIG